MGPALAPGPKGCMGSPKSAARVGRQAPGHWPPDPAPRHRGPQALVPPGAGSEAHGLETNLAGIKGALGPSSQLGHQWTNPLQYNECICFLHKL